VQGAGGEWIISRLKTTGNKPLKEETVAVNTWLGQSQMGI